MAVPDSQGFVTPHQGGSSLLALLPNCSLPVQPGVVGVGPGIAAGRDQAVAQQELGEPVPGPHEIRADVLAGPHQILGCLLRGGRDPHRGDLAQQGQTGQMLGIPGIGLHPVPGGSLEFGRRRDRASPASTANIVHGLGYRRRFAAAPQFTRRRRTGQEQV